MYYNPYNYFPDVYSDLDVRQGINTFFEHINETGLSFTINSGNNLPFLGDFWNDRLSSVRVAPRTVVLLYEHRDFGGRNISLVNRGILPEFSIFTPHLYFLMTKLHRFELFEFAK
ncbi:beta/gamma crystallin domain-containing protein [Peribacillus sp. NJ4]|nr:beta/gamma crystallin domain-containing protein [Peribacillus sp. NJ4]